MEPFLIITNCIFYLHQPFFELHSFKVVSTAAIGYKALIIAVILPWHRDVTPSCQVFLFGKFERKNLQKAGFGYRSRLTRIQLRQRRMRLRAMSRKRRKQRKSSRNTGNGSLLMRHNLNGFEKYWEWELTNETQPKWLRNPEEVITEEYNEFYKKTFNEYLEPLASSHFTTEGEVEFRSILYVPSIPPTGKDEIANPKTKNIRLYVKRVFISDDFDGELFPWYLSFVKGVGKDTNCE